MFLILETKVHGQGKFCLSKLELVWLHTLFFSLILHYNQVTISYEKFSQYEILLRALGCVFLPFCLHSLSYLRILKKLNKFQSTQSSLPLFSWKIVNEMIKKTFSIDLLGTEWQIQITVMQVSLVIPLKVRANENSQLNEFRNLVHTETSYKIPANV